MPEFDLDPVAMDQGRLELVEPSWKHRAQQVMRNFADGFLPGPSVQQLRPVVPIGDDIVHVADEHRVVGEVEEARLLAQHLRCRLALERKQGCQRDRENADKSPDQRWPMGEAVLQQKAERRDGNTRGRDEQQSAALDEAAGQQHHDRVKDCDGDA